MPDASALAKLGSTPIPGGSPVGAAARYEPGVEKLAAEIAKLESIQGRASVRWDDVISLSMSILGAKSKDLLVAGYLTAGLCQRKGFSGLATGLQICRDLMSTYWEGLFPEKGRMRARASAMQWMAERVGGI